ncbi:MAG: DUF2851 family protein [Prevotella sp.]|nr:DUF2851 family protein [Prevotella sp.]
MKEALLHYVWKHRLLPVGDLMTTDGQLVEVVDPGLHNRNAGPDFFNAKVKVGGTLWVGNVEIHNSSSDWYQHGHDRDAAYDNVVLHVCAVIDRDDILTASGRRLPQVKISVPPVVLDHYEQLIHTDKYPPCYQIIPSLSPLLVHSWMSALQTERLEQKTEAISRRVALCDGSWEAAYFTTLARNFGFGINGDAFEQWALSIPLSAVGHHRDDLFQVEAIFMGQAGLLSPDSLLERYRENAMAEGYFTRLRNEYLYLQHKFSLKPIDHHLWRFLRLRPQNFPYIRISQLAQLYFGCRASLSQIVECKSVKEFLEVLDTQATEYWQTHYVFGAESTRSSKRLSAASRKLIIINTVVPVLFAYGRHKRDDRLCDRAFDLLEELQAEKNHITQMWQECGLSVTTAGDSQALIQLKNEYCDRKDCLRCRIGFEYLKRQ